MKNGSFRSRIGYAVAGWRAAWRRERSFRTQAGVGALALLVLIVTRPPPVWWAVILLTSALVIALELINSAVEALVDLLHPAIHPEVKALKDMLAGAVLAISCAALAVAAAFAVEYLRPWLAALEP